MAGGNKVSLCFKTFSILKFGKRFFDTFLLPFVYKFIFYCQKYPLAKLNPHENTIFHFSTKINTHDFSVFLTLSAKCYMRVNSPVIVFSRQVFSIILSKKNSMFFVLLFIRPLRHSINHMLKSHFN